MKNRILKALKEARGPVSGQRLADELAISRSALWKHVQKLRNAGYRIEGSPKIGYRLLSSPDIIVADELEVLLPPVFQGNVVRLESTDSTNNLAKEMATRGRFKPAGLVVAETQDAGRGRFDRLWLSPRGGIWFSLVVRPELSVGEAVRTPLLASVIIAEAISAAIGIKAGIKWPNDILIGGRKVAGILTEMAAEVGRVEYLVVGIGLNANFLAADLAGSPDQGDDFAPGSTATTIFDETGTVIDRTSLIAKIATGIWKDLPLLGSDFGDILDRWRCLSVTLGRKVTVTTAGEQIAGKAVDIDSEGGLIVLSDAGQRKVFRTGEVTLRKP